MVQRVTLLINHINLIYRFACLNSRLNNNNNKKNSVPSAVCVSVTGFNQCLFIFIFNHVFFFFSDEFLNLSSGGSIFGIIFPFIFTSIKIISWNTSCIWSCVGTIFWLFLFRPTGYPYSRFTSNMLYCDTYTKSTNCATVSVVV